MALDLDLDMELGEYKLGLAHKLVGVQPWDIDMKQRV